MTIQPKLQPGHDGKSNMLKQAEARSWQHLDPRPAEKIERIEAAAALSTGCGTGHDGEPPVFAPTRDIEAVDRWTGKRIRERVDGPTNINVDRIEWLFTHGVIEQRHHQAARRLQKDWEVGLIMPYAQMGVVAGNSGKPDFTPAHAKMEAMERFGDAKRAVGPKGFRIIDLVALQAMSVQKAAAAMRVHNLKAQGMLIVALDILAQHYRIA